RFFGASSDSRDTSRDRGLHTEREHEERGRPSGTVSERRDQGEQHRSAVSMPAPGVARRAFVDPSGRRRELAGGLHVSLSAMRSGAVGPYRRFPLIKEIRSHMRRRDFMTVVGGVVVWTRASDAQQPPRNRPLVGALYPGDPSASI